MQAKLDLNHGFPEGPGFFVKVFLQGNLDGGDLQI